MIQLPAEVSGRFRIEKRHGPVVTERREFNNLVLDLGFSELVSMFRGSNAWHMGRYLFLGTGDAEPERSDPGLQQRSSLPGRLLTGNPSYRNFSDLPNGEFYADVTLRFDYPVGAATGLWSEIGTASDAAYTLPYNRALIRDENDAPTPLVVQSFESLSVWLTLRLREGLGFPVRGKTVIEGKEIGFTVSPLVSRYWTNNSYSPWASGYANRAAILLNASGGALTYREPEWPAANRTVSPSVSYSHSKAARRTRMTFTLNESNATVNVWGVAFGPTTNPVDQIYQLMLDSPISKVQTHSLRFVCALTFSRNQQD